MKLSASLICVPVIVIGVIGRAMAGDVYAEGEAYLPQTPHLSQNPAFVPQLPETALQRPAVETPAARPHKAGSRNMKPKTRTAGLAKAAKPPVPEFPSVGRGATAMLAPPAVDAGFPSVGAGTVRR